MTVSELREALEEFGDHLPVRILVETASGVPAVDTAFGIGVEDREVDAEVTVLLTVDRDDAISAA